MADTFDDLAALAVSGNGLLIRTGSKWSYPGAQRQGTNLRVPSPNVDDSRVRAALEAEAWRVWRVDASGQADMVCATDGPHGKAVLPLKPSDMGTARSMVA